ncbi:MAG TPA: hypothetical protein VK771_05060 [Acidimicrobiia bacterium]|jgi:hypothetical protein|nr:hypothetical protein [Acidimicrobiia bacterium]
MTTTSPRTTPPIPASGLPSDQVHEWLEHVHEDLRRVRARLEYLRAEQSRLENQQRLLVNLLAATAP